MTPQHSPTAPAALPGLAYLGALHSLPALVGQQQLLKLLLAQVRKVIEPLCEQRALAAAARRCHPCIPLLDPGVCCCQLL
jgi:hypothetical protein